MALRKQLIQLTDDNKNDVFDVIHKANPATMSLTDLMFLLRLVHPRANNPLAYLQLEAKMWFEDNIDTIKSRVAEIQ